MSEVDQISYYYDGLKRATPHSYIKLQNPTSLSEAMDEGVKYEMSHFGGERRPGREGSERDQRFRGLLRPILSQAKKPFHKRSYKPGHDAPAEQTKNEHVCFYCKKPGHFKRDSNKLKNDQGNENPRR
ncbi:hypothetical protein PHPALM_27898 [Phytophthora palmivora]|uniref:CCHC-type domain-containing protein n=1 Tax=Phytophthora palmivora TaxID=4796 RepID=A0A2P4XBF1_9STRA|nr:hypothetical protein PHPALM_27898 [Phytophthora palmivora]